MRLLADPRLTPVAVVVLCAFTAGRFGMRGDIGQAGYWLICAVLFAWVTFAMKG